MPLGDRTEDPDTGIVHKTDHHIYTHCRRLITGEWKVGPPLYKDEEVNLCKKCFGDSHE